MELEARTRLLRVTKLPFLFYSQVVGLISQSISDMVANWMWQMSAASSGASVGSKSSSSGLSRPFSRSTAPDKRDFQNRFRSYWHQASLLGSGCGSIALLAELEGDSFSRVVDFGRHFAIAQQVRKHFSGDQTFHDNSLFFFPSLSSSLYIFVSLCSLATTMLACYRDPWMTMR